MFIYPLGKPVPLSYMNTKAHHYFCGVAITENGNIDNNLNSPYHMKNPVIFRVGRSRPPKIGCLAIIFLMIAFCGIIVSSCKNTSKGRIEQKFEEYIKSNLANPNDFVEIASIELEDSLDMRELCKLYIYESCPDSIQTKISHLVESCASIANRAPQWFKDESRNHVWNLIHSESSYVRLDAKWQYLKDEFEKVDSLNLVQKMYIIKARIKESGNVTLKNYYAVDYMIVDSLAIDDKPILHNNSPREVLVLTDALEDYMEVVRIKMDYLQEWIDFYNKLQQVIL